MARQIFDYTCNKPYDYLQEDFLKNLVHEEVIMAEEQQFELPKIFLNESNCLVKYGDPYLENNMVLWDVPTNLEIGVIPRRIYCNQDLVEPLSQAFHNLINTGCVDEMFTWDGCFNIRTIRGGSSYSLHAWGIAVDINASENGLGKIGKLSTEFINCFKAAGFHSGSDFTRRDYMHFQLARI